MSTNLDYKITADTADAVRAIDATVAKLRKLGEVKVDDPTEQLKKGLTQYADALGRVHKQSGQFAKKGPPVSISVTANTEEAKAKVQALMAQLQAQVAGKPLNVAVNANASSLTGINKALAALGRAASSTAGGGLSALRGAMRAVSSVAGGLVKGLGAIGGSLTSLPGIAAAIASFVGLKSAITGVYESIVQTQKTFAKLKFANGGDLAATAEDMRFAKEQADRLGMPLKVVEDGYSSLSIAMRENGFTQVEAREAFLGAAEASRVMGLSADDTNSVLKAMGQIAGKGVLSMEELRQQLGERLPIVMSVAAKSMGTTTDKLIEEISRGNIKSKDFLARFGSGLRSTVEGELPDAVNTLQSNVNRASNALEELKRAIGEDNEGTLNEAVQKFTTILKAEDTIETVRAIGTAIVEFGVWTLEAFNKARQGLSDAKEWFADFKLDLAIFAGAIEDTFGQLFRRLAVFWGQFVALSMRNLSRLLTGLGWVLSAVGMDTLALMARNGAREVSGAEEILVGSLKKVADEYDRVAATGSNAQETAIQNAIKQREAAAEAKKAAELQRELNKAIKEGDAVFNSTDQAIQGFDKVPYKPGVNADKAKAEAANLAKAMRTANIAFVRAAKDAELKIAAASRKAEEQQLQLSLARQTATYDEYLAKRSDNERAALAEQIAENKEALAEAERAQKAATSKPEARKFETEAVKLRGEIAALEASGIELEARITLDKEAFKRQVQELGEDLRAELLSLQGDSLNANLAQIDAAKRRLLADDKVRGNAELEGVVSEQARIKQDRAYYDEQVRLADAAAAKLALLEAQIQRQAAQGHITELDAQRQIREARLATAAATADQVEEASRLAEAIGDPALLAAVDQLRDKYSELANTVNETAKSVNDAFFGGLKQGFTDLVQGTKGFKDVMLDLLTSVLTKMAEVATNQWIGQLAGAMGGSSGGIGGAFASLLGFASGGAVRGPGTGTSDSILAKLSNGEFVIKARSVAALGLQNLQYMNQTGRLPAFAAGGLAGAAQTAFSPTINTPVTVAPTPVYLDGDLIAGALGSSRVFENVVTSLGRRNFNRIKS